MTIDEFRKRTQYLNRDWQLTIKKSDRHQLCCSSTVPVEKVEIGFDWTHGQVIFIPSTKLVTDPEITDRQTEQTLKDYAIKCSDYLRILAKIATLVDQIENGNDKNKLNNVLEELRKKNDK